MRWSMLPVSIGVHVVILAAALLVPLTADDGLPKPAPMRGLTPAMIKTVPVPPEVIPAAPSMRSTRNVPSVIAPDKISPPVDEPVSLSGPPSLDVPAGVGAVDFGAIGNSLVTGVPPVAPPPLPDPPPPPTKIYRAGQGVREPRRIAGGAPEYPVIARNARVQGTVVLEAIINERGGIERIRVVKSEPLLDGAAIAAVRGWRYTPTLLNGVPVSVMMTITINFTLQN